MNVLPSLHSLEALFIDSYNLSAQDFATGFRSLQRRRDHGVNLVTQIESPTRALRSRDALWMVLADVLLHQGRSADENAAPVKVYVRSITYEEVSDCTRRGLSICADVAIRKSYCALQTARPRLRRLLGLYPGLSTNSLRVRQRDRE